jgi:hypothetical protein
LPYSTGGGVDAGLVDTGTGDIYGGGDGGGMVPGTPINADVTGGEDGGYSTGLEESPAAVADSGAIAPSYDQPMDTGGGYADQGMTPSYGGGESEVADLAPVSESFDYGATEGEIASPAVAATMMPVPATPVSTPVSVPPIPVQVAEEETMFPLPSEVSGEETLADTEMPSQEPADLESGADQEFDTAPTLVPASMTQGGRKHKGDRGGFDFSSDTGEGDDLELS